MSTVVRWRPVSPANKFFNEFDRLFTDVNERNRNLVPTSWKLALDVIENDDNFTVKASIPGIDAENIDVTLDDNVLTVKGEIAEEETKEEEKYHLRERRHGSFSRSIRFPVLVDSDSVEASYHNGILTLAISKAEEMKPKRIPVSVN